jgi:hypothetical protein
MKQTALLIAAAATSLALAGAWAKPGGMGAAHPAMPPHAGAAHHPPGDAAHGMRGEGRGRRHGPGQFGGVGLPFAVPFSGPEIVTHDFVDPRAYAGPPYPPRRIPRSITILEDKPLVFREPPHIVELGPHRRRRPIFVVRRGVISEE